MPTFNYLTSDGKSLKVNTDSLNDESKEKIKTFIKGDLAKKESLFVRNSKNFLIKNVVFSSQKT